MITIATSMFWNNSDDDFLRGPEAWVVSMVTAGRYNFDIGSRQFGMGLMASTEGDVYNVYVNPELYDNSISERMQQIGLQGWIFYFIAKAGIPHPLFAIRLGCCLALAIVLSLICIELNKKYGLLFAGIFFIVSISSSWITNFAPNLYWVTFTWFMPMLLGLICLNHLNKRVWLYPLFFLAILIKAACGYEYMTVIMLSSIMFLAVEWICAIKRDKQYSKLLFKTVFEIGIMSLLGFAVAVLINSHMRGDGNILNGFNAIYRQDVLRSTFGNSADFHEVIANSLNASIVDVLVMYFSMDISGIFALLLLGTSVAIFIHKYRNKRYPYDKDFWLFILSFLTCISWFVLGKSHSFGHLHMNFVMWYMGFIQVCVYVVVKDILQSDECNQLLRNFGEKLR
jgi:hypothetical protein